MKTAILQVADTGPLESLVVMLRAVGYGCYLPNNQIKNALRNLGCDTVLDVRGLVDSWGYDQPFTLPVADLDMMDTVDLYVDIKAHRNGPKIWDRWPRLKSRTLWYRINGCAPEHVIRADGLDCGDEVNPPCPVLTPNQWYATDGPWSDRSYTCWPPFYRIDNYSSPRTNNYSQAICLIHNLNGWGYGAIADGVRDLGVHCYGVGSPDGLINHSEIPRILSTALAMVHLKSSDSPGYALYEALAAACPLVVTRRLIWRSHMEELFEPGRNCLVFDQPTHDALTEHDVAECLREISDALDQLSDPQENRRIGEAGRERLMEIMWDADVDYDVDSFNEFMVNMFGK